MNHLFLFTLGPVQTFIAQARKAQDLYAGSLLLSELTRSAIDEAAKKQGIDIVFPDVAKCDESVPNRFIGLCDHADAAKGQAIEKAVRDRLRAIAKDALRDGLAKPDFFDEQVASLLEVYWLFHPVPDAGDYVAVLQEAERWFGALKNIRGNAPMPPEAGRKCNVDGARNVKFYRCFPTEKADAQLFGAKLFQPAGGQAVRVFAHNEAFPGLPAILQPGEGLSAVSFLKRRFEANKVEPFESTAAVALMDDVQRLLEPKPESQNGRTKGAEAYRAFKGVFERRVDYFDEQLFYEENLSKAYLRKYGYAAVLEKAEDWKTIETSHAVLQGWLKQKYYAILLFDGDHMGNLIGGQYLQDKSRATVLEFQRTLSGLLGDFAQSARATLSKPKGRTIYAGGDDFLGFVNLHHLLEVLCTLREQFHEQVHAPLQTRFDLREASGEPFYFTFSAGVAVAHYKIPLNIVLSEAREAEKYAKKAGRNALGITILKHSGETHTAALRWSAATDMAPAANARLLQGLFDGLQGGYSDQFIQALQTLTARLPDDHFKIRSDVDGPLATELRRLVLRAKPDDKSAEDAKEWADKTVFPLFAACDHDFKAFMQLLSSIHFLHQKMPVRV